jgi:hypothetical protein
MASSRGGLAITADAAGCSTIAAAVVFMLPHSQPLRWFGVIRLRP